ncbi:carbohydrate ABC transporter permease [Micromonospora endophytica]|uniref:Sugar ABC transporter permease n=1 Tax=Micromonospora endophytica TaxID=515350 RepID=A0A2W2DAU5_9ACTN|nr:sugar ABC transporter permease [Micromonospora endophytica]PZG01049.1 sugar ABC transporter permease [Micromonospora endophytica]RIW47909.1 sugar ABC transporter permease [Micromonospora endophytica]BCJ62280.1 ABC transporter permease [Micromonospora endophytica]
MVDSIRPPAKAPRTGDVPRGPEPARPRQRNWRRRRLNRYTGAPLVLISVNLLLFGTFFVWPAITGLMYSFTSYTGVGPAPFVGLDNYQRLLQDEAFYSALIRTLIFTAGVVPLTIVLSLATAVLLVTPYTKGKAVARVVFFLPWLISPIIAGVIWRWLFGENFGFVNYIIISLGGSELPWQSNANLSLIVVIIAGAWANTAFNMLLFVAALKNVPTVYYEAASLDGAGSWAKFRRITLPAIAPTTFIVVLLTILNSMKEYALFKTLNDGGPGTANNLLVQYIYTKGFERAQIGYASAASFVLMLILMIVAIVQLVMNRRKES